MFTLAFAAMLFQVVPATLGDIITAAVGIIADLAPDYSVYLVAGIVISLGLLLFRRALKAAR